MEKRAIIAVVLSIAFLYAYSYLFPQPQHKPVPEPVQTVQKQVEQQAVNSPSVATASSVQSPALPSGAASQAKDITVDTDSYTAIFSTQGASLKKFVLKKYRESAVAGSPRIELAGESGVNAATLVSASQGFGVVPTAVYAASADSVKVSGNEKKQLTFTTTTPTGISFKKTFIFQGSSYAFDLQQQVANVGQAKVEGALGISLVDRVDTKAADSRFEVHGPFSYVDGKLMTDKVKDLAKAQKTYDRNVLWSGFADKYFLRAILTQDNSLASVRISQPTATAVENAVMSPTLSIAPGEGKSVSYKLYFGPKDMDTLKAQGGHLEEVIDLGWFSAIAKPLLHALKFLYTYTGNYGIAIIIITVILKLLFFPLTQSSYKSMKEMQKLQPKMAEMREKYKNDRDTMNKKVMELYKDHKVNPLGGCLPMVVQIPVFFALYKALMFSFELRQAPFFFWIVDLSAKDPFYVTPIIMGITMFVQQKMTPTNMDPMQAKMMLALPVVFTFMFLSFPSGLVLYWLVNNILTISQQWYINKSVQA